MRPIDAYNHTVLRAKTFLLYHDGLMNTRARRIRADWKASFLKIMHWASKTKIDRVDGKDAILVLRPTATLTAAHFSAACLDDLLRASLTFGVSALDRYVHERVVKGIIKALNTKDLTRQQEELSMPAVVTLTIAEEIRKARQQGKHIRASNIVRRKLQELLHRRPFQSWRELEYAFNLLGITNLAGQLQRAYGVPNMKPIKDQLNHIAVRRNAIVHEGDLLRHQRGGKARMHPVSRKYVDDTLTFLDGLVAHLENVH